MKYLVQMSMLVRSYTFVEVEADNVEQAKRKARKMGREEEVEWCDSTMPYDVRVETIRIPDGGDK